MSLPNALIHRVTHLPVPGFNPSPVRTETGLTILYRRKQGTYAQRVSNDATTAIGTPTTLHPHLEDCRVLQHTSPVYISGALYNHPTRQAQLTAVFTPDGPQLLTNPQQLTLSNGPAPTRPRPQKNWQPFLLPDGSMYVAYDAWPFTIMSPSHIPNTWSITARNPWTLPPWAAKLQHRPRMSTAPVPAPNSQLLWLWHIKDKNAGYWTGATLSDDKHPFIVRATANAPIFTPADAQGLSPHWPPNRCIFPMTLTIPHAHQLDIWAGDSDRTSIRATIATAAMLNLMRPTA